MRRFNRWARRQLWWLAFLIAASLAVGLFTGGFQSGWNTVQWIVIGAVGVAFVILILDGWFEWRRRRSSDDS